MRPLIDEIIREAAAQEGLFVRDLMIHARDAEIVAVRQRAMWACRELRPDVSLPRLGTTFGGRHHTSILQAVRKCKERRQTDPEERAAGDRLLAGCRSGPVKPLSPEVRALVEAAVSQVTLDMAADHAGLGEMAARSMLLAIGRKCLRVIGADPWAKDAGDGR